MRRPVWLTPMMLTTMVIGVLSMNVFALPVVAPHAAADLALDPSWIGIYSAVIFGTAIGSSLAGGALVVRFGPIRTGQICLALGALAALLAASGWLTPIGLSAVVLGLAFGPETPAASHLLARVTKPCNRALLFSIKQCGMQIGGIGAGLLMPWLLGLWGWQFALVIISSAALVAIFILQPAREVYDTDRDARALIRFTILGQAIRLVSGSHMLRCLAAAAFCYSALQQCFNTFLVIYLVRGLGYSLVSAGAALAVGQVAGIAGRLALGAAADRLLPTRSVLIAVGLLMTVGTLGLAMVGAGSSEAIVAAVCALIGASATGWNGVFLAEVARIAPHGRAGEATGGMLSAAYGGLVFGPIAFGLLLRAGFSYASCYGVMAVVAAAGAAVLVSARGERRTAPSQGVEGLAVNRALDRGHQ